MKKFDIKKSFKDKKFKYGGYATAVTAVVLVILIVVNLVATKADHKFDLTQNKVFSLSQQTYKILDGLNQNVQVYGFYESGKEDKTVQQILEKYSSRTKKLTVTYKDPVKYPQFAAQFSTTGSTISDGTLVVAMGTKYKVIAQSSLVNYDYSDASNPTPDSLAVEQNITGAISYVTSDVNPVAFNLQGHGEAALPQEISTQLGTQNYTIKDINLVTKDAQITDGSTLLINSPQRDLSSDEVSKLKDFISKGGKLMILSDIVLTDMPNFKALLAYVGVSVNNEPIIEGSSQNSANNPIYLLPNIQAQDITNPIISAKLPIIMPAAQGISTLSVKRSSLTITPLLVTSSNSWAKKNVKSTTEEKESGDPEGPFTVAVAITDKSSSGDTTKDSRIVITGTSKFTDSTIISMSNKANVDFFMNSMNWLEGNGKSISIQPKSIVPTTLTVNSLQAQSLALLIVVVIPGAIIIAGIVIWLRRRHR